MFPFINVIRPGSQVIINRLGKTDDRDGFRSGDTDSAYCRLDARIEYQIGTCSGGKDIFFSFAPVRETLL